MKHGSLGVWFSTNGLDTAELVELAQAVEKGGYETLWYPEALAYEAMSLGSFLLSQTSRLKLATGIANIYARDGMAAVAGHDGLNKIYGGRFTLGLGVSHKPMVSGRRNQAYGKPLTAMREYLEGMEKAGLDPKFALDDRNVVLAALGPKMLELARDKTKGALPYNVTPEHTAMAKEILGPDRLLCVEQKICLTTDASAARASAKRNMKRYMPLPNYYNNWLRLGFSESELADGGNDRFLDAMVAWGSEAQIRERIDAHFAAGATHVCIQPLRPDDSWAPCYRAIEAFAPGR